MLAYTTIGTNDYDKSNAFYAELLSALGAKVLFANERFTGYGTDMSAPMFAVVKPYDEQPATTGNGTMITLACKDTAQVDALHAKALALGASCEGEPGPRADGAFYLCYFRDTDGHKIAGFYPGT